MRNFFDYVLSQRRKVLCKDFVPSPKRWRLFPGGVDLAIVPCVAMTVKGDRLGHGKGYYDAFLNQAKATTIAPIFREQIVEDIPMEEHDWKIDHVLFMPMPMP